MSGIFLVFPNTLFKNINIIEELINNKKIKEIYIIEENTYFKKFKFHKQKIILHRSSMKFYYDYLLFNFGAIIKYINFNKSNVFYKSIINKYNIYLFDPIDHDLLNKIKKLSENVEVFDNLSFMETYDDLLQYNQTVKNNKYRHDDFYKWNRNRLNILLDSNDKPLFGKWSFDTDNRLNFRNDYKEPKWIPTTYFNNTINEYIDEAKQYVNKYFDNNFGEINEDFIYPITFDQALKMLKHFLKHKINTFGHFQDAVSKNILFGSHSCLSSSINIGLITVEDCIKLTMKKFNSLSPSEKKSNIHNYEGFLRQIIGWRSYTRLLYEFHGKSMYKMNFLGHNKKITKKWYNGTTNIYPIDVLIDKVKKYAYLHHIERLMYIGNWALLTEIDPKEIYKWFMITCIDSYEWVMISNIHGMSQHALDNNIVSMMTRPYFSSTNYLKNMSDLVYLSHRENNKNDEWIEIWNNMYYYFIYKNRDYLKSNYSTSRQVVHWDNKYVNEKNKIINNAREYLLE
jgi:deoxyribodipyrimidine photolyase-related protein